MPHKGMCDRGDAWHRDCQRNHMRRRDRPGQSRRRGDIRRSAIPRGRTNRQRDMNTPQHIGAGQAGARLAVTFLLLLALGAAPTQPPPAKPPTPASKPGAGSTSFKPEEIEQLVSQIALYPDSLISQVLMASTYPLEVVQAERWMNENKELKGDAQTAALEKKSWDPSVKSLIAFPQVLTMMSKQLEWTTKLGDAFIADQKAVMAAVQKLRAKAQATGNLKTTAEQKVTVQKAEQPQVVVVDGSPPPPAQVIVIEPTNPQVVYVPAYNPSVVYGPWPYPYYPPPAPYYPPGYVASNLVSFGAGVAVGAAWGYAWGGCNWNHGDVDVDVNRNANFNRNINRENYQANIQKRTGNAQVGQFQHDPAHRQGVSYRDQATANKYGGAGAADAAKARDNYRGRAEAGRQDIARGGAADYRGDARTAGARSSGSFDTGRAGGLSDSGRAGGTGAGAGGARTSQSPSRGSSAGSSAFSGVNQGGSAARSSSSRGDASRSSAPSRSYSAPSRSSGGGGASRGGGGGGRGGGGRGGGRR